MMFYDRLTGVQIKDLPEQILPGRYCYKKTLTQLLLQLATRNQLRHRQEIQILEIFFLILQI